MWLFKLLSIAIILLITIIAGLYPFIKQYQKQQPQDFPIGESLAAGVFLGAGLIHMLGDATNHFNDLHFNYPLSFLIAGAAFLFFLLLEHIGREIYQSQGSSQTFALSAVIMLSIHSFFTGAALGLIHSLSMSLMVLIAIVIHKWAASFALAVTINKSHFNLSSKIILFSTFALMVPLGIIFGSSVSQYLALNPIIEPVFLSISAGTFIYLGTLHGLERTALIQQCCNLSGYIFVIMGFAVMAIVALWA